MPNDIKSFEERSIDIIFYEKYSDSNRLKQGLQLLKFLNNTNKKLQVIKYGHYKRNLLVSLANDSKYLIYFSFYDCGPVALKEMQNYGVIIFAHQKEFITSDKAGYYIPELDDKDMTAGFIKIMNIINNLSKNHPDSKIIANINQNINRCERTLDDLCNGIIKSHN